MKKIKWIFAILIIVCGLLLSPSPQYTVFASDEDVVEIENITLRTRLRELLDKDENDRLYIDDFLEHNDYAAKDAGDNTLKANKNCLDLSGCNITDITELSQFIFPITLDTINLSYNNITYTQFEKIYDFITYTQGQEITLSSGKTITCRTNFSTLKCINVSNNNIDLKQVYDDPSININNEVFIYGLQNFNRSLNNTIVTEEDLNDTCFYLRSNDFNKFSITIYYYTDPAIITRPEHALSLTYNTLTYLKDKDVGKYEILISALENSYLDGMTFENLSYVLIKAKIDPNSGSNSEYFEVERLGNFTVPNNLINIQGLGSLEHTKSNRDGATTQSVGIKEGNDGCPVILEVTGYPTKKLLLPYKVIDTTAPVITLIGGNSIIWNLNTPWVDPGYIVTDNGENINAVIVPPENVKHMLIGEYTLTYSYTDDSGNTTTVVRLVTVESGVLSQITLYTTNEKIKVGEEVVLIAGPYNIDNDKYTDFEYTWFVNNEIVKTSEGDQTHKSSFTITPQDKSNINIKVKVTAKHIADGKIITVYSNELVLEPKGTMSPTTITVVIFVSAVLIIMIAISITTILKYKKSGIATKSTKSTKSSSNKSSKSSTNSSTKKKNKKQKNDDDDDDKKGITIIRDYKN